MPVWKTLCCLLFHRLYFLLFANFSMCFYIFYSLVIPLIFITYLWKSLTVFLLFLAQLFLLCPCICPPFPAYYFPFLIYTFSRKEALPAVYLCPQLASAWLWGGGGSWRKLHVAFPLVLAAAGEMFSHSLAHGHGALLDLWLQETQRLKLTPIRRANHSVACGSP